MIASSVDEHTLFIPTCTLQSHVLIHSTHTLQLPVTDAQNYSTEWTHHVVTELQHRVEATHTHHIHRTSFSTEWRLDTHHVVTDTQN